uniref:Acyl-CoA dehydrogenase n=1 Tax=Parastrongyloides trichosuri TaxID=131310 RepID=A0A0N4ZM18_PARTI
MLTNFKNSVNTYKRLCSSLNQGLTFDFTKEQLKIKESSFKFAKEEIIPVATEYDKSTKFPWDVIKKAHQAKLINSIVPKQYGGVGLDSVSEVIIAENLAYGCTGVSISFFINALAATPLIVAGSENIKKKYLSLLAEEPIVVSYAVTEASAGSDVAGIRTRCEKKGDEYILNGSKMWISNAGHAKWIYVLARSDSNPKVSAGKAFTSFVVDADTPGITIGRKEINMGLRCADTRGITFEDVRIPASQVVGAPGEGFKVTMKAFDKTRPFVSAGANGIAARAIDEASKYVLERGLSYIQNISSTLADMATNLEIARLITYKAAKCIDDNHPESIYSSMAKCIAADTANQAVANAVEIMGIDGLSKKYPVEKLMRDAKIFQIFGGTSEIQKMIISRQILKKMENSGSLFY